MVVNTRAQKKAEAAVAHPIDKKVQVKLPLKSTSKKVETKALSKTLEGLQAAASDNLKFAQFQSQINDVGGTPHGGIADPMVIDAAGNGPEGGAQEPIGAASKTGAASKADSSNSKQNNHQEGQNNGDSGNTSLSKSTSSQGSSESSSSARATESTGSARSASAESTGSSSTGSTGSATAIEATSPAPRESPKAKFNGPKGSSNASMSTADEDPEDVVVPQVLGRTGGGELEGYISMGFQKWLIVAHGPPQARLYDHENVKSNENSASDLRASRLAKARGTKKIIALQGVVWAGGPHDFERLMPPTTPEKRGTPPLIKCKWEYNGEIRKTWETRGTVRKYYPRSRIDDIDYLYRGAVILEKGSDISIADKAIMVCAIRCAERYDEYMNPGVPEDIKGHSLDSHIKGEEGLFVPNK